MSARVSFLAVVLALIGLFVQEQTQTSGQQQSPPASQPQTGAETDRNREATDDRRTELNSQSLNAVPAATGTQAEGAGIEGTGTTGWGENGAGRRHMMKS